MRPPRNRGSRIVLVAEVARLLVADGDLLGQAGAQRVGAGDDNRHPPHQARGRRSGSARTLARKSSCGHRDLAVLVAALLLVGHLVLDLQRAGASLDHLLGKQVGRLGVAEAGVDVSDNRNDMGLDGSSTASAKSFFSLAASPAFAGRVDLAVEVAEFALRRPDAGRCRVSSIRAGTEVFSCID